MWLIEAKAGRTIRPAMASSVLALSRALPKRPDRMVVVHRKSGSASATTAIAPKVEAMDVEQFVEKLN